MRNLSESRVLIVDDVKSNVDVLVQALRDDYKLSVALSGASALQAIEKAPPDLVLLDIMMPDLDGYEVCRRIRAMPQAREVPVMFLSALDEATDKARGFEVGGNDYLSKPFEALEVEPGPVAAEGQGVHRRGPREDRRRVADRPRDPAGAAADRPGRRGPRHGAGGPRRARARRCRSAATSTT